MRSSDEALIVNVSTMMQRCLSAHSCDAGGFYLQTVGNENTPWNITITRSNKDSPSDSSTLYSFKLRTDYIELTSVNCVPTTIQKMEAGRQRLTRKFRGTLAMAQFVLQADVKIDSEGHVYVSNSRPSFGDWMSFPVHLAGITRTDNVNLLKMYIDAVC
ncbi:unnamed protein product [Mesocestoides corti]|uniref:IRS-type PTB domain-containing protein n=1 Tax=Mesocestoides corti TaxID=53468 RepID=A0A0R3U7H1_MESCO|nr:unnamed protein product [Mesocestoides corti]